jgi:hypothetical protein
MLLTLLHLSLVALLYIPKAFLKIGPPQRVELPPVALVSAPILYFGD